MNTQTRLSASRLIAMTLACLMAVCLAACGGDNEPSVDELLSDKTTPVTFQLPQGDYYMFDYSGSRYVGSDTIHVDWLGKCEVELRQGKHNILWVRYGGDGREYAGVIYDTATRRFLHHGGRQELSYGWTGIEVSPYLHPIQKVSLEYLTATLQIEPSDDLPFMPVDNGSYAYEGMAPVGLTYRFVAIGEFSGMPAVTSVSAVDGKCSIEQTVGRFPIAAAGIFNSAKQEVAMSKRCIAMPVLTLVPTDGMSDILLSSLVKDNADNPIITTSLPTFSIKPGFITILRGPLFSGSTADWTVTMDPYKE